MGREYHQYMDNATSDRADASPFGDLRVGLNVRELERVFAEWSKSATPPARLQARNLGIPHWGAAAAASGGVVGLSLTLGESGDGRTYTSGAYPLQSMPRELRSAVTPDEPYRRVVSLDLRASHWQLVARLSGDYVLMEAIGNGRLYEAFEDLGDRASVKRAMNASLHGVGDAALVRIFGSEVAARAFSRRLEDCFRDSWPLAADWLRAASTLDDPLWKQLMRAEAAALVSATRSRQFIASGARLMVPMHDGLVLSLPEESAEGMAPHLAAAMAGALQRALVSPEDSHRWVSWKTSASWDGDAPTLVGDQLRSEAYAALVCGDGSIPGAAVAALFPDDVGREARKHHHMTDDGRRLRSAMVEAEAALEWGQRHRVRDEHGELAAKFHGSVGDYTTLRRVLEADERAPALSFDVRSREILIGETPADDRRIRSSFLPLFQGVYGLRDVREGTVFSAVHDAARGREVDPVAAYFEGLPEWDGVSRIGSWLPDYAGVEDDSGLAGAYGWKWLLSVVARTYDPGCKVDTILCVVGRQGAGKSTMFKVLAPGGSYADIPLDPSDKDAVRRAGGYAVVEWGELSGLSRREQADLKAYLSRGTDLVRLPYATQDERLERRGVFVATTNKAKFLADETGSRRYWVVRCGSRVRVSDLARDRDQLWAEALLVYRGLGQAVRPRPHLLTSEDWEDVCRYRWWLSPEAEEDREADNQDFEGEDPYADSVAAYSEECGGVVRMSELMDRLGVSVTDRGRMAPVLEATLSRLGFERERRGPRGSVPCWVCRDAGEGAPSGTAEVAADLARRAQLTATGLCEALGMGTSADFQREAAETLRALGYRKTDEKLPGKGRLWQRAEGAEDPGTPWPAPRITP